MSRRVAVVGCRPPKGYCELDRDHDASGWLFYKILHAVGRFVETLPDGTIVVSGWAAGVDSRAVSVARECGLETVEHKPNYAEHGGRAPLERNKLIVADADEVHAWPAPWSRGTWHACRVARDARKPVTIHRVR